MFFVLQAQEYSAFSVIESSCIDDPIFPPKALINVNDIPPPIIMSSTLSIIFSIMGFLMKFSSPLKQQGLEKLHFITFFKEELPFQVAFQKTCFQNILQQRGQRALCALCQKHHSRSSLHAGTAFGKPLITLGFFTIET